MFYTEEPDAVVPHVRFCGGSVQLTMDRSVRRQHKGLPWEEESDERFIGRGEIGAIYEQWVWVSGRDGKVFR